MTQEAIGTKAEQVAAALVAKIHNGSLAEGDKIPSERQLAKDLGVSRNAVREALTALQISGQIKTVLGDGSYVTLARLPSSSPESDTITASISIGDALELREGLEIAAVGLAVRRATRADHLRMEACLLEMSDHLANQDFASYLEMTYELHRQSAKASHSDAIARLTDGVLTAVTANQWVLADQYDHEVADYSYQVHRRMFEGIVAGDLTTAVKATSDHYEHYPVWECRLLPPAELKKDA